MPGRRWTPAEISALGELAARGARVGELAAVLRRPLLQTQRKARKLGITITRLVPRVFTPPMVERLREMVAIGHPAPSVAHNLGLTAEHVRRKCAAIGLRLKRATPTAEVRFGTTRTIFDELAREANVRGLSVAQLGRLVLETALRDEILGAIIDAPPTKPPRPPGAPHIGRPVRPMTESQFAGRNGASGLKV